MIAIDDLYILSKPVKNLLYQLGPKELLKNILCENKV